MNPCWFVDRFNTINKIMIRNLQDRPLALILSGSSRRLDMLDYTQRILMALSRAATPVLCFILNLDGTCKILASDCKATFATEGLQRHTFGEIVSCALKHIPSQHVPFMLSTISEFCTSSATSGASNDVGSSTRGGDAASSDDAVAAAASQPEFKLNSSHLELWQMTIESKLIKNFLVVDFSDALKTLQLVYGICTLVCPDSFVKLSAFCPFGNATILEYWNATAPFLIDGIFETDDVVHCMAVTWTILDVPTTENHDKLDWPMCVQEPRSQLLSKTKKYKSQHALTQCRLEELMNEIYPREILEDLEIPSNLSVYRELFKSQHNGSVKVTEMLVTLDDCWETMSEKKCLLDPNDFLSEKRKQKFPHILKSVDRNAFPVSIPIAETLSEVMNPFFSWKFNKSLSSILFRNSKSYEDRSLSFCVLAPIMSASLLQINDTLSVGHEHTSKILQLLKCLVYTSNEVLVRQLKYLIMTASHTTLKSYDVFPWLLQIVSFVNINYVAQVREAGRHEFLLKETQRRLAVLENRPCILDKDLEIALMKEHGERRYLGPSGAKRLGKDKEFLRARLLAEHAKIHGDPSQQQSFLIGDQSLTKSANENKVKEELASVLEKDFKGERVEYESLDPDQLFMIDPNDTMFWCHAIWTLFQQHQDFKKLQKQINILCSVQSFLRRSLETVDEIDKINWHKCTFCISKHMDDILRKCSGVLQLAETTFAEFRRVYQDAVYEQNPFCFGWRKILLQKRASDGFISKIEKSEEFRLHSKMLEKQIRKRDEHKMKLFKQIVNNWKQTIEPDKLSQIAGLFVKAVLSVTQKLKSSKYQYKIVERLGNVLYHSVNVNDVAADSDIEIPASIQYSESKVNALALAYYILIESRQLELTFDSNTNRYTCDRS